MYTTRPVLYRSHPPHPNASFSGVRESLIASDSTDGEDVNRISMPYMIDPGAQHGTFSQFLLQEAQEGLSSAAGHGAHWGRGIGDSDRSSHARHERDRELVRGFSLRRDDRQLKQIITVGDTFYEDKISYDVSGASEGLKSCSIGEGGGASSEEGITMSPMFECNWQHIDRSSNSGSSSFAGKSITAFGVELVTRPSVFESPFKDEEEIVTESLLEDSTRHETSEFAEQKEQLAGGGSLDTSIGEWGDFSGSTV